MNKFIGDNIKKLRKLKGWSQEDLAVNTGYSQSHISEIEKGLDIRYSELKKFEEVLNTSIYEIINENPDSTIINVNTTDNATSTQTYVGKHVTININNIPVEELNTWLKGSKLYDSIIDHNKAVE